MTVYFGVHEDGIEKSYVFLTQESFLRELSKPGNALPRYDARMAWNVAEEGDKERFTFFSGAAAYICWQAFLSHTKIDRLEVYVYIAPQLLKEPKPAAVYSHIKNLGFHAEEYGRFSGFVNEKEGSIMRFYNNIMPFHILISSDVEDLRNWEGVGILYGMAGDWDGYSILDTASETTMANTIASIADLSIRRLSDPIFPAIIGARHINTTDILDKTDAQRYGLSIPCFRIWNNVIPVSDEEYDLYTHDANFGKYRVVKNISERLKYPEKHGISRELADKCIKSLGVEKIWEC